MVLFRSLGAGSVSNPDDMKARALAFFANANAAAAAAAAAVGGSGGGGGGAASGDGGDAGAPAPRRAGGDDQQWPRGSGDSGDSGGEEAGGGGGSPLLGRTAEAQLRAWLRCVVPCSRRPRLIVVCDHHRERELWKGGPETPPHC
jgi:hypothetical protein